MNYYRDNYRHLVCVPYSIANLHLMANKLKIKSHWFHKDHYDIPKKMINDKNLIENTKLITSKEIVKIIKGTFKE